MDELASTGEVAVGVPKRGDIPGRERAERIRSVLVYIVLTLIAILFAVPFFWSVLTSLKPLSETLSFTFLPETWTVSAYHSVFTEFSCGRYTLNSVIFATVGTLMIPDQLRLVPIYQLLVNVLPKYLHVTLVPSRLGFILINLVSATSLFLMRQYFLTIPRELEEAAKLDAAGYFKTFWRVMLPLAGPALAAVTILTFQGTWNGLFWPLIIFQDPSLYTLPVGIARFHQVYTTLWPELMAASVIALVPIVALYVFFQRYFVAGVAAAAVKG